MSSGFYWKLIKNSLEKRTETVQDQGLYEALMKASRRKTRTFGISPLPGRVYIYNRESIIKCVIKLIRFYDPRSKTTKTKSSFSLPRPLKLFPGYNSYSILMHIPASAEESSNLQSNTQRVVDDRGKRSVVELLICSGGSHELFLLIQHHCTMPPPMKWSQSALHVSSLSSAPQQSEVVSSFDGWMPELLSNFNPHSGGQETCKKSCRTFMGIWSGRSEDEVDDGDRYRTCSLLRSPPGGIETSLARLGSRWKSRKRLCALQDGWSFVIGRGGGGAGKRRVTRRNDRSTTIELTKLPVPFVYGQHVNSHCRIINKILISP